MIRLLFLLLLARPALAQINISGFVSDQAGRPLPYASIGLTGKAVGTLSDESGRFTLTLTSSQRNDSLKISCIGYKPRVFVVAQLLAQAEQTISLEALPHQLDEVVIRPKKVREKVLGTKRYNTLNCTGFVDVGGNWKGSEAAILVKNNEKVLLQSFSFYVIQNKYADSLLFRLMLYKKTGKNGVGETFLKKPVIFKLGLKQGEFTLPLGDYSITTSQDFFISLECLMNEMDISRFCYAGSNHVDSYCKLKAFSAWQSSVGQRSGGGGADFNVKVLVLDTAMKGN